jgi:hypothetical protein
MKVLLQHREVICTSPTTLAIYSSSLGIPTSILIDPEFSQALGIVNEGKGVDRLRDYDSKVGELSKKLLGESFAVRELTESKIKLSLKYLGVESFQSPQSLRAILPVTSGMIPVPSEE